MTLAVSEVRFGGIVLLWLKFWFNYAYLSLVIKMCLLLFNVWLCNAYFNDILVDSSSS